MFLITSLTVTRSRIVRTKYVSSITITSLPAYFACPLGDDQLAYGVRREQPPTERNRKSVRQTCPKDGKPTVSGMPINIIIL